MIAFLTMNASLADITSFLDDTLKTEAVADYNHALNGLQVENKGQIIRIAVAVDASEHAIRQAIEIGANLLIVHHGLFWSGLAPVTGAWHRKLSLCIEHDLAVYSSHLPLDIHPLYGNNAVMAKACGMKITNQKGLCMNGNEVGLVCEFDGTLKELANRIQEATGEEVRVYTKTGEKNEDSSPGAILLCSGGAGDELPKVATMGIRTFISGEGSHWTIPMAVEEGMNLIYAGHYATETFGVKALASLLTERFGIPSSFIEDAPAPFICSSL